MLLRTGDRQLDQNQRPPVDSRLAVQYAERRVTSSHRLDPNSLPILAQAYLEDGQLEEADRTVGEGLSHLAPQRPGTPVVRCRLLLKHNAFLRPGQRWRRDLPSREPV